MTVGNRIGLEKLVNIWILIIERCEINLIKIVDSGVDVAVEDIVGFELKVLLHGLEILGNVGTIFIQNFQGLIGAIIDFIVEVVSVLA
jgi:hypothetical protein